jgi:hypothetical protein
MDHTMIEFLKQAYFVIRMIRVICRQITGRWFYLVDEPDWVIDELSKGIPAYYPDCNELRIIVEEARHEKTRRKHRSLNA